MAAPTTTDDLLALVRKSNLLTQERLEAFLTQAGDALPTEPAALAETMVQAGLITRFQAEQFLLGKWRGFTLGKYRVLERLGVGGTGTVYLCEHQVMRRRVAVKVLPVTKADNPAALGRFYREARAAGQLDHPNLVKAHDIDMDNGLHFLVMEYVDGTSLQHIVARFGPLAIERVAHYMRQAALGLQAAHEAGLIHRDIKPANILLDRQGVVRILDLGLARFFSDDEDPLTLKYDEKNVLGTADYVAPEQALNSHDVDIRADIYSLGATCYLLLTGQPLFPDGKAAQKLIWHQVRKPTPVNQLRPEVPAGLSAVVDRMLAKDPGQRYQTPAEVAEALAPWTSTPIPPPASGEMPRLSPAATGQSADIDLGGPQTPSPRPDPWTRAVPTTPVPSMPGARLLQAAASFPTAPPTGQPQPAVYTPAPSMLSARLPQPAASVPSVTKTAQPQAAVSAPAPSMPGARLLQTHNPPLQTPPAAPAPVLPATRLLAARSMPTSPSPPQPPKPAPVPPTPTPRQLPSEPSSQLETPEPPAVPSPPRRPALPSPVNPSRRTVETLRRPAPPTRPQKSSNLFTIVVVLTTSAVLGLGARVVFERMRHAELRPVPVNGQSPAPGNNSSP